ncbi:putative cation efflux system protein [Desulfurococcus amylolyticus 1221n]|uniref:Putative cation efflux system protein n=2 Tax=Desulfurococcaceae TaxID=2272 RepID=B8D2L2_DESA1|nr:putative cation efflux system protein [Desulfurococcus amylolyticus 1221n]
MVYSMPSSKEEAGYLEGCVSIIVNTLLFIIKLYTGILANSIAIIADAFHTLSDSITSAALIIGYKIAFKPPDEEHPFGHQRFESVTSIIIGTLLGVVGFEFIQRSISKLISRETLIFSWIAVILLTVSVIAKELLARWALGLATRFNAESIKADAWHHRSDAVATQIVLIGLFMSRLVWWIDGVLGLMVSGLIIYVAYDIIKRSSKNILGRSPTPSEKSKLKELASRISGNIRDLHHVHLHEYGEHVEVTLHIRLPPDINLNEAHEIASKLEELIRKELKWEATIHVEPYKD